MQLDPQQEASIHVLAQATYASKSEEMVSVEHNSAKLEGGAGGADGNSLQVSRLN